MDNFKPVMLVSVLHTAMRRAAVGEKEFQVKILRAKDGPVIDRVSSAEAFRLARLREYEGIGTPKRVKKMWALHPDPQWQPCYRTQGSPAIGPWAGGSPDWFSNYRTAPRA